MTDLDFSLESLAPEPKVYRLDPASRGRAVTSALGGAACVIFVGATLAASAFQSGDPAFLRIAGIVAGISAAGLLVSAWLTWRTPEAVTVTHAGLTLASRSGTTTYPWDELAEVSPVTAPMTQRRVLHLRTGSGRHLARLSDALVGFDELAELIRAHTRSEEPASDEARLRRSRRSALLIGLGGAAFLALSLFVGGSGLHDERGERLLRTSAVAGNAAIERRFIAPNGVTPRLVYHVTTPSGKSASRNAQVTRSYWESLAGASEVPVRYVPEEPEFSRLAQGEVASRDVMDRPGVTQGIALLGVLISLLLLYGASLQWRGLDLKQDSKTGKWSIGKFGG